MKELISQNQYYFFGTITELRNLIKERKEVIKQ